MTPFKLSILSLVAAFGMQSLSAYDHKPRSLKVRTTAYTHTESDHLGFGRKNAISSDLQFTREYTSAASDWSRFPLGTEFRIVGINRHFIIDDYGCALCGKDTIDLYFTSKKDMNRWGARNVEIVITKYGDFDKSAKILRSRTKWYHCRKMYEGIKKNKKESSGKIYQNQPLPHIDTELDIDLMAAASIPLDEWIWESPMIESDVPTDIQLLANTESMEDIQVNPIEVAALGSAGLVETIVKRNYRSAFNPDTNHGDFGSSLQVSSGIDGWLNQAGDLEGIDPPGIPELSTDMIEMDVSMDESFTTVASVELIEPATMILASVDMGRSMLPSLDDPGLTSSDTIKPAASKDESKKTSPKKTPSTKPTIKSQKPSTTEKKNVIQMLGRAVTSPFSKGNTSKKRSQTNRSSVSKPRKFIRRR